MKASDPLYVSIVAVAFGAGIAGVAYRTMPFTKPMDAPNVRSVVETADPSASDPDPVTPTQTPHDTGSEPKAPSEPTVPGPELSTTIAISTYKALQPDAVPGTDAVIDEAGTHIPVNLEGHIDGPTFTLELRAHNEIFEREVYFHGLNEFDLREAVGDVFTPDLPLIKFPAHAGDRWNWVGTVASGGSSSCPTGLPASAKIATNLGQVMIGDSEVRCINVEVMLDLAVSGDPHSARRKLKFSIVPGKGVVRRAFGDESVREPALPK